MASPPVPSDRLVTGDAPNRARADATTGTAADESLRGGVVPGAVDGAPVGVPATVRASASRPSIFVILAFFAVLYIARELFLPVVLAALFSFLLAPVVSWFERLRLHRVLAVGLVALVTFAFFTGIGFLIGKQLGDLAMRLPDYKANLVRKVADLKPGTDNPMTRAMTTLHEIATEAGKSTPPGAPAPAAGQPSPMKVEIVRSPGRLESIAAWLRPLAAPMGQTAVVAVLVIFMLLGREDVRDRLIHLAGRNRLRLTTQALNDAGRRVSRYLLAQTLVNVGYGVVAGLGLYFIGVPNALLWGIMYGLLRFLPYVGPWLGAAGPLFLSLAISDSWHQPSARVRAICRH